MNKKVILMSIDGMRPDGLLACGNGAAEYFMSRATYCLNAKTVIPSITLPCHMSLFYSVIPQRHGIISNTFVPQVHQVKGLFEKIHAMGGFSAAFYGWENMRSVWPDGCCRYSLFQNAYTDESVDTLLTDEAIKLIEEKKPDFVYLYQVETDEKGGHDNGWMTEEYLHRVAIATDNARRIIEKFSGEYTIVITADHGGHDRMHGTDSPEDTTIPVFFIGEDFTPGKALPSLSILDITPTVAKVMGIPAEREWEGKSLI
jgi:predicted AlkP superfamily pyrophosphatase or phosphodiesterase